MRRLALLSLALLAVGCRRGEFRVAGTITLSSNLQHHLPKENAVLFVVVKNRGGVPVAVRRIVNPQFPVEFEVRPQDLLVPELHGHDGLLLQVQMNTHGNVGAPVKGDLAGDHPDLVYPGEKTVHVVIDRRL